jgi:uncharacterized membrane protein HdeD (DUF308 family)
VLGGVLIIAGIVASRSVADHLSNAFLGHLTRNTTWYFVGGIVSAIIGLVLSLGLIGRRR